MRASAATGWRPTRACASFWSASAGAEVRGQRFVRGPGGKPGLPAGGATVFSLSHTDGLALIGVARGGTIGVDLERTRPLRMSSRAAATRSWPWRRRPRGRSRRQIRTSDEALLRAWCRLEAFAKARGEGLSHVLGELGLRNAGGRQLPGKQIAAAARHLARQAGLEIADVKLPRGLYGAVAAAGPRLSRPRPRRFPADLSRHSPNSLAARLTASPRGQIGRTGSERSAAWLAHQSGGLGVGSSNLPAPTNTSRAWTDASLQLLSTRQRTAS